MDEEEELEDTLIGQEEAPAVNTEDALIGQPRFLPYADDVAPSRTDALSVFTPGGKLKPDIDVNVITPSPVSTNPTGFATNTALNKEVVVPPAPEKPGFFEEGGFGYEYLGPRLGANMGKFFGEQLYGTGITADGQITGFPVDRPSLAGDLLTLPGNVIRAIDLVAGPPVDLAVDKFPDVVDYVTGASGVQAQQDAKAARAAEAAQDAEATPTAASQFLTPDPLVLPSETLGQIPSVNPFSLESAEQVNPISQAVNEIPILGATPRASASGLTTVGGASLSEFLSGQAMPERGFVREERPLSGRGVTLTPEQMDDLSEEREARLAARLPGDQSVSDRERRASRGEGISMADRTAMAKANARGATPREVAYGNQVAAELGVDIKTGLPLQTETEGLTFDQQLALRKQRFAEDKFDYELTKDLKADFDAGIKASKEATVDEAKAETSGKTMVSAISNMNDAMTRMAGRSDEFFGSGFFGRASSFVPGTSAYDQVADAEFLQSNVALGAMAELKRLSSTGATGFGSLSERELNVLTAKFANLNPFVSPELFQSNLRQLQGEFNNMLDNAWNTHSAEYGEEAANKIYGNRGGGASRTTGGTGGTTSGAIPGDRNVASAADALLSDPKYN